MNTRIRHFFRQYLGVVLTTLVPVILITFMSLTLGGHATEAPVAKTSVNQTAS